MYDRSPMSTNRIVTVTLNPAVDRVIEAPGFAVGKRVDGRVVAWYPTGGGITLSRVLAVLGDRSIATGFVGQAELAFFEEHLERSGEGRTVCQFLLCRDRTRDNLTIVDPINDTETHIRDQAFNVTEDDVRRMASKLSMLARTGSIMCFGRSLPPGVSPAQFGRMVGRCVNQGARVVINVDEEALRGLAGRTVWLAKLNVRQLSQMSERPVHDEASVIEAARALTTREGGHIEHVMATRGADGAILVGEGLTLLGQVSVHPGRVVSTVGCGEALLAGVVSKWDRTGDWEQAMREGLAVATANAVGQEAGGVEMDDVEEFRFMAMVQQA